MGGRQARSAILTWTHRVGILVPVRASMGWGLKMSFLVGLVLFVGVCGFLDARLPWTTRNRRTRR